MKVLCIESTPKPLEKSYGRRMIRAFVEEYKKNNPEDTVDLLNLYESHYPPLSAEDIEEALTVGRGRMVEEAEKFKSYDKYIIGAPMWNLGIPSALKSYIDHIVVSGVTFKYNSLGIPKGLLKNKSVFYIGTRGGYYPFPISLFAHDISYVKFILKFIGIKKFKGFLLDGIDQKPERTARRFEKTLERVRSHARRF